MGYKFKLNKNTKHKHLSVNGINLSKEWSQEFSNKPQELSEQLRHRSNLDGIIDFQYTSDTGNPTVYFESERDCASDIVLYHKSEFASMPRIELLKIAEMYDIKGAPYLPEKPLQDALNDAQYIFEQKLLKAKVALEPLYSPMRKYLTENERK